MSLDSTPTGAADPNKRIRRGTRVSIAVNPPESLDLLVGIESPFPAKYHQLLSAVFALCLSDPEGKTDVYELSDRTELSKPTIRLYLDRLTRSGLFTKSRVAARGHKPAHIYTMVSVNAYVQSGPKIVEDSRDLALGEGGAAEPGHVQLDGTMEFDPLESIDFSGLPDAPDRYRAELFSTYTLLSALRLGKSGQRLKGSYIADARIGPARLRIRVSSQDGYRVAGIMDTKSLIGISTYAREYYGSNGDLDRPLILDIPDFTAYLLLSPSGGNKRHVWGSIRSWEKTGFQVLAADESIRNFFDGARFFLDEFRFITRIKTVFSGTTPSRIALTLEPSFLKRILDPEGRYLSAVHSEIMREKSAARLLCYYWSRRAIKYETKKQFWPLDRLRSDMARHMEPGEFKNTIMNALRIDPSQENAQTHNPEQVLYGYRVKPVFGLDGAFIGIEIGADPDDRLCRAYNQRNPAFLK